MMNQEIYESALVAEINEAWSAAARAAAAAARVGRGTGLAHRKALGRSHLASLATKLDLRPLGAQISKSGSLADSRSQEKTSRSFGSRRASLKRFKDKLHMASWMTREWKARKYPKAFIARVNRSKNPKYDL